MWSTGTRSRIVAKWLAQQWMSARGWTIHSEIPASLDKYVLIGAPHTSNWDLAYSLATASILEMDFHWVGKKELFEMPGLGWLMRKTGGIPVDRHSRTNTVEQIAAHFRRHDRIVLTIAPEGTRGPTDRWKTGFYHIARAAGVPIVAGALDYQKREARLSAPIDSSQPLDQLMAYLRRYYSGVRGRNHENFTPPTL